MMYWKLLRGEDAEADAGFFFVLCSRGCTLFLHGNGVVWCTLSFSLFVSFNFPLVYRDRGFFCPLFFFTAGNMLR